jgi:parvulin-like peptidyl-prolyl isomerase
VARAAQELEAGQVGEPVRGADGYYVLRARARLPGEVPDFEQVQEEVRAEYLRSLGDRALREYLDELRRGGEVRILDPGLR